MTKQVEYIRGKLHWFRALGDPVDNYGKDGKEWIFDLAVDEDGLKQIKGTKVQGKPALNVKDKDDDRGKFVTFKQKYRELKRKGANGETLWSKPPRVIDAAGKPWDPDVKIGNGTVADVKFEIVDYGAGKFPGIYPQAVRILNHVPYEGGDFKPLAEDDEFFSKPEPGYVPSKDEFLGYGQRTVDDLEDDIP